MLGPLTLGGSHHPDHHLESLILDLLQWARTPPPQGPLFGSPMGHSGPMPLHGMRGPPPLMHTLALHDLHPIATSGEPSLHPDPLPSLQFPLEAHYKALSLSDFSLSFLLL